MFIIYNRETTVAIKDKYCINVRRFGSRGAVTRYFNEKKLDREKWAYATVNDFFELIEKQEVCINLMSGKPFSQSVNTPLCCDPSSETYWSM